MVIASARSPAPAGVDVIGEIAQDYGWKLLASGKQGLWLVRWPRLLERLSGKLDGQPFLSRCPRGTKRGEACSIVPMHVHWQVHFSTTRRLAAIYVAYTVAADARGFMGGTCLSGP